jgi:hypothetical protein
VTDMDPWETDIRDRLRNDMSGTLHEFFGDTEVPNRDDLLDYLVGDAMHQVYKVAEEGRP